MLTIPTCPAPRSQVKITPIERFDGAEWFEMETSDQIITVTSAGRELLYGSAVLELLQEYAQDINHERSGPDTARHFITNGGNANVYALGDTPLVVKEKKLGSTDQLLPSMDRMDHITHAVETHCPRWIKIPLHYAVSTLKADPRKQFMLIEKVDSGLTVGDVAGADAEPREPHLADALTEAFGPVTPEIKQEVLGRYELMRDVVRLALQVEGMNPSDYLKDFNNKYNCLVEPLETPIAGSNLRLSVIDQ